MMNRLWRGVATKGTITVNCIDFKDDLFFFKLEYFFSECSIPFLTLKYFLHDTECANSKVFYFSLKYFHLFHIVLSIFFSQCTILPFSSCFIKFSCMKFDNFKLYCMVDNNEICIPVWLWNWSISVWLNLVLSNNEKKIPNVMYINFNEF